MTRVLRKRAAGRIAVLLAALLLAASAWPADQALLWSVADSQGSRGFLLGTIHSEDPRVLDFTESFLADLRANEVFAMELVPDQATLSQLSARMQLPPGASLEDMAGRQRFEALVEALDAYGVPAAQVRRMQPWAAMMTLSVPPPQTGLFMDFSLSLRASGSGLQVISLETLAEQLAFLEGMDLAQQLELLDHAIEAAGEVQDVHDEMVEVYLTNDLERLHRLALDQLAGVAAESREIFLEEGIAARNHRMMDKLLPHLRGGRVFIAVGALHLPGEQGLLALLREQGYLLAPAPWPFNAPP